MQNVYKYDMVSAYVWAGTQPLPVGMPMRVITDKLMGCGFYRFRVLYTPKKYPMPYMSAREEEWGTFNGEIYQRGEVFVRASCEIEFMLKLGYDLEILDGIVFPRTEAVMKKFFLDIYKVPDRYRIGSCC